MFKSINSPGLIFKILTSLFRFFGGGGSVEKEETGPENKEGLDEGPREGERPPPRNAGEGEKQAGEVGPSGGEATGREPQLKDPSRVEAGPRDEEEEWTSFLTFARRACEGVQLGEPGGKG